MDSEIQAMAKISEALNDLEVDARARVLTWAADRYSIKIKSTPPKGGESRGSEEEENGGNNGSGSKSYDTLAELFAAVSPNTWADKVLVAAYWHQEILGKTELISRELNKDLKDLGHGVKNISEKFDTLIGQKPQLALQLKKTGISKQAQKKYKITDAGKKKIIDQIKNNSIDS